MLARPGWAGSGVAPEAWWRSAVFYCLDPARFQATGSEPKGDLAGVAERLDYLQSLGVDALVLDSVDEAGGLDDLVREASRRHLRLLVTVTPAMQSGDRQRLLQAVHDWLSAGAAGVWLPRATAADPFARADAASLASALRMLLRSFPGERVMLLESTAQPASLPPRGSRQRGPEGPGETQVVQLSTAAELPVNPATAAALRQSLLAVAEAGGGTKAPGLLRFADAPLTGSPQAAAAASLLFLSRGTALFDFGDEIGLRTVDSKTASNGGTPPVMQWTPMNVQQAPAAPIERAAPEPAKPGETPFGAYHPYIHPPPRNLTGAAPAGPRVTVDGNLPAALPDPNTLPGFTMGPLPNPPVEGEAINVATEDRDPRSLLNAYRQLIALHHGDATLRDGAQTVLNRDAQNAVVLLRRAPGGSRTAADVVVAVNLGGEPVVLSLDGDLAGLGVRSGALRSLFFWSREPLTGETTGALRLPPFGVYVGEVVRAGSARAARSSRQGR